MPSRQSLTNRTFCRKPAEITSSSSRQVITIGSLPSNVIRTLCSVMPNTHSCPRKRRQRFLRLAGAFASPADQFGRDRERIALHVGATDRGRDVHQEIVNAVGATDEILDLVEIEGEPFLAIDPVVDTVILDLQGRIFGVGFTQPFDGDLDFVGLHQCEDDTAGFANLRLAEHLLLELQGLLASGFRWQAHGQMPCAVAGAPPANASKSMSQSKRTAYLARQSSTTLRRIWSAVGR